MLLSQKVLRSLLLASAAAAQEAQVPSSSDIVPVPSAREIIAEAVVPLEGMILTRGAVPIGSDLRAMIAAGRLEIRLRMEYQDSASVMVITTYLAIPGDQLPAEKRPPDTSGTVLQMLKVKTDFVRGEVLRDGNLALAGTLSKERVPWLGAHVPVGTPVTVQLQLKTESTQLVEHMTLSWPGSALTGTGELTSISPPTRVPNEPSRCIQGSSFCSPHPRRH
jgi:hypothetical protein